MKNEMMNVTEKTPIEVLLKIDNNGFTTAKNLYKFLELDSSNYAKWCKRNINENPYAEENVDYIINSFSGTSLTGRGNYTDYKISSAFAKKLAMTSNSIKGEQARDYFIAVEKKLKEKMITDNKKNNAILSIVNAKDDISRALAIKDYTDTIEKPLIETIDRYQRFLCEKQGILTKKSLASKLDTSPVVIAKILKQYGIYTPVKNEISEDFKSKYPNIKLIIETENKFKSRTTNEIIVKKDWQYTYEGAKAVVDFLIEKGKVEFTDNNGFKIKK